MTEWLKEEEKPAVNKRKQEEKKPQKAEIAEEDLMKAKEK